jgi:hypothetical protein
MSVTDILDLRVTELQDAGGPCNIHVAERVHLPAVDGETGAVTILLGLDGEDRDEVRLAVGVGQHARGVLDEAIEALLACRQALEGGGGYGARRTDGA